jgi:hypothetical protein
MEACPMKVTIALKQWLPVYLLLTLIGTSAAQVQPAREIPKQAELKLPALLTSKPIREDPVDDELRKLLKARYNLVFAEMQKIYRAWRMGLERVDVVTELAQQLVESGLELTDKPAERVAFLAQFVGLMREAEEIAKEEYNHGMASHYQVYRLRYRRLQAEILLLRAKREVEEARDR